MNSTGLKHILCAVDFSQYSPVVVSWGAVFARRFQARLTVMHTIHNPGDPIYASTEFERGGELKRRLADARERMAALMQDSPAAWDPLIVQGDPAVVTADEAGRLEADLVIAASHGLSAFKRLFVGTVVERLARRVPCPLLVLRDTVKKADGAFAGAPPGLHRIVAACDFSKSSDHALGLAAFLARSFDAKLYLAHVMESPVNEDLLDNTAGHYADVQAILTRKIDAKLRKCVPADPIGNVRIDTFLGQGLPGEQLLAAAGKLAADMVVIGVRYRHALEKMLVGSTTEAMLRHAPCPVLVVPGSTALPAEDDRKKMSGPTGIVRDTRFLKHETGKGHPEQPERLARIYAMLDRDMPASAVAEVAARKADDEEILMVHSRAYLEQVAATRQNQSGALAQDTPTSSGSYAAALLAVGKMFALIDKVVAGELKNGFALVRPPGHHAEQNRAMGYCIFNNVALGAVYARKAHGLERILIVDWDVHHGNGTQHAFEKDPWALFFSVHQFTHFPGTGSFTETGSGPGEGYTVNIPLSRGYGPADYLSLFDRALKPLALEFKPDLVLVSAGFDSHQSDPLGGMRMNTEGFSAITRILMDIADATCRGRLVLSLEGGYDPASLEDSVKAVLMELAGLSHNPVERLLTGANEKRVSYVLQRLKHVHKNHWRCFR